VTGRTGNTLGRQRRDLLDVDDVETLVRRFYGNVAQDELLGPMFNTVARVDWNEHIAKLTNFWSRTLFGVGDYLGNPLAAHQRVHQQVEYTAAHFERWLDLFEDAVDGGWKGENAAKVKRIARKVARLHSVKLIGCPYEHPVQERTETTSAQPEVEESLLIIETKHPAR